MSIPDSFFPETFFIVVKSYGQLADSKMVISVFMQIPEFLDGGVLKTEDVYIGDVPGIIEEDSNGFFWFKPVGLNRIKK